MPLRTDVVNKEIDSIVKTEPMVNIKALAQVTIRSFRGPKISKNHIDRKLKLKIMFDGDTFYLYSRHNIVARFARYRLCPNFFSDIRFEILEHSSSKKLKLSFEIHKVSGAFASGEMVAVIPMEDPGVLFFPLLRRFDELFPREHVPPNLTDLFKRVVRRPESPRFYPISPFPPPMSPYSGGGQGYTMSGPMFSTPVSSPSAPPGPPR